MANNHIETPGTIMGVEEKDKRFLPPLLPLTCYCVIALGIILAVTQYLYNRSLWHDEAALANNLINRDFLELTKQLDFDQVAPIGFLFVEKILVLIFGDNEFALRLFSLTSFLFSVPLFYRLSFKLSSNRKITLTATAFFCISLPMLYYATELKQYSSDVLIALATFSATTTFHFDRIRSLFFLAVFGALTIWISNTLVIVLFVSGCYLLYTEAYEKENYKVLLTILVWMVSFLIYYVFFIHNHPTAAFMKEYWVNSFLPLNPLSKDFYSFGYRAIKGVFGNFSLITDHIWLTPILFIISMAAIKKLITEKGYPLLYLCFTPIVVHLLLSSLSLYPFSERFVLYITPLTTLLIATGLYHLFEIASTKTRELPQFLLAIPVLIVLYSTASSITFEREEVRDSLNYIEDRIQNNETIYAYYGAQHAITYYTETQFENLNNQMVFGTKNRDEIFKYDQEIFRLKGKVWLLFSHVYPFKDGGEEKYMMELLMDRNAELLDKMEFTESTVYYVDTKTPSREES